ncbi:MAG TPA: sigma-70 family RNA polymerase sigma factor [Kofleriaceae bacterium]|nr:sigma-70 family RNA polymerase sigma factor [Kofleriaceae bacterium]
MEPCAAGGAPTLDRQPSALVSAVAAASALATTPAVTPADPDHELAARFRDGDRAAFDILVRRHQKGMWRLVRRYVKSDADAADVTQLAFVRAFRGLAAFRGTATVRSWLYRIAINCSLSWLRDHRREQPTELAEDALTASNPAPAQLSADDDHARLRRAIAQLPPKQKLVLELRVFDDLSFREVAELADCSENTAKVNFHYAVKRLRDILGADHEP